MKFYLRLLVSGVLCTFGCSGEGKKASPDTDGTGGAGTGGSSSGGATSGGATSIPIEGVVDCNKLPDKPLSIKEVPGARGYHGLAITPDGKLLGSDGSSLLQVTYDGDVSVFTPGVGDGEQMDWLPDGDLVMASHDDIIRIDSSGAKATIAADVNAYGVTVGPDGLVYTVGNFSGEILRIDPKNGNREVIRKAVWDESDFEDLDEEDWENGPREPIPHSAGFSRDGTRFYVGNISNADLEEGGSIGGSLNTEGPVAPLLIADLGNDGVLSDFRDPKISVGKGWHDAVGVDACDNLYVPDYSSSTLYRVSSSGEVSVFWDAGDKDYPHSLVWGTGEHGWRADAIYMSQPYKENHVVELVIGVPSSAYEGEVLNRDDQKL